jgi:hypothetical protein
MKKTTMDWLIGLYTGYNYRKAKLHIMDKQRWLGGIEAYLLELEILPEGTLIHEYRKKEKKYFLGIFPYTMEETYEELILRIAKTTIEEHNSTKNR